MGAIGYDRSVVNYIPELSATKHVTHVAHTKTSVTLHHNAGKLTHTQLLAVWKTRAASAHFDVDAAGSVAQYVEVDEYAWAVGSTAGNETSISIEMCNSTLAPNWEVSDTTLNAACRLAGWLFAHVIKAEPTKDNFFPHKHWSSTDCPGPYVSSEWSSLLTKVQTAYHSFVGTAVSKPPSTNHETNDKVADEVIAGKWGNDPGRTKALTAAGYNAKTIQTLVNEKLKKKSSSPAPSKPSTPAKKSIAEVAKDVEAGKYGNGDERTKKLKDAGYDPAAVQAQVNKDLADKSSTPKKSVNELAHEVLEGKWGNDPERTEKLTAAGYDAKAVQNEVNKLA